MTTYKLGLAAAALVTAFAVNAQTTPQADDCNTAPAAKTAKQKPGVVEQVAGNVAGGVTKDAGRAASKEITSAVKDLFGSYGKHLGGVNREITAATKAATNAATQTATGAAQSAAGAVTETAANAFTKCAKPATPAAAASTPAAQPEQAAPEAVAPANDDAGKKNLETLKGFGKKFGLGF